MACSVRSAARLLSEVYEAVHSFPKKPEEVPREFSPNVLPLSLVCWGPRGNDRRAYWSSSVREPTVYRAQYNGASSWVFGLTEDLGYRHCCLEVFACLSLCICASSLTRSGGGGGRDEALDVAPLGSEPCFSPGPALAAESHAEFLAVASHFPSLNL